MKHVKSFELANYYKELIPSAVSEQQSLVKEVISAHAKRWNCQWGYLDAKVMSQAHNCFLSYA